MNTEITGLTMTEWFLMVATTVLLCGWAYFDHNVLVIGPYGRVDPILLAAMLTPAIFLLMKDGETYLRARSQQVMTSLGLMSVMQFGPQTGGGDIEAVPFCIDKEGWKTALPKLTPLRCGVSRPMLPVISGKPRYIFAPEKHLKKYGGVIICMSDVSRFDGGRHNNLISNVRDKMVELPGVTLEEDSVIFGDNLSSSWPRLETVEGFDEQIYVIPSTPKTTYNKQVERAKNREFVTVQELRKKMEWSVDKLRGKGLFGGI